MGVDEQTIREIIRRILTVANPDRVILFGSAATGEMTRDSDIDLLIVEDTAPEENRGKRARIRRALRGMGYPFDVIVMDRRRFDDTKGAVGTIAFPANKNGRIIYEAA